jgi:hypothetical protein
VKQQVYGCKQTSFLRVCCGCFLLIDAQLARVYFEPGVRGGGAYFSVLRKAYMFRLRREMEFNRDNESTTGGAIVLWVVLCAINVTCPIGLYAALHPFVIAYDTECLSEHWIPLHHVPSL